MACRHLTRAEVEGVNFQYMPLEEALAAYPISQWEQGYVSAAEGDLYYINNPATGLWASEHKWFSQISSLTK